jgi:hypothetical protein
MFILFPRHGCEQVNDLCLVRFENNNDSNFLYMRGQSKHDFYRLRRYSFQIIHILLLFSGVRENFKNHRLSMHGLQEQILLKNTMRTDGLYSSVSITSKSLFKRPKSTLFPLHGMRAISRIQIRKESRHVLRLDFFHFKC